MFAFQHSYLSNLALNTRVTDYDFTPRGGTNQNNFNCSPATIQIAGVSGYYPSATSATTISSAQADAPCNQIDGAYLLPKETRDNALARFTQEFGDLTLSTTLLVANRKDVQFTSNGTISGATAFGPGSANPAQINPFYMNPPGVTASKQTIRFDLHGLLPRGVQPSGAADMYANFNLRYRLGGDWEVQAWALASQDNSFSDTYGGLCGSCALLALNGTTNSGGSTTTPSVVGTTLISTQTLTPDNALDVWNPPATNRTSAATIQAISQGFTGITEINSMQQFKISADGSLFDLPAGPLKVAFGADSIDYGLTQKVVKTNSEGPASYGSGFSVFHFPRSVASFYGEADFALVSPEMGVPLVNKLDFDISGRYDSYSDVGNTANPKFAADWTVIEGLKLRGSYSTSFVAPQQDSIGDPSNNYRAAYGGAGLFSSVTTFPLALYPDALNVLPGCTTAYAAAHNNNCQVGTATTQGITLQRGIGPNAKPEKGNGYTVGVDFAPDFLPGFTANVTLFDAHFKGAVTSPNASVLPTVSSLNYLFKIYPAGLSLNSPEVQAALAPYPTLNSALPTTVYVIDDQSQNNIENLFAQGLDMSFTYEFDTDFGHFRLQENATEFLQYDISFGYPVEGPRYSLLNTDGQTSQFPEIQLQSRGNIGWSNGPYALDLFVNYTGSYRNWANPANPIIQDPINKVPIGGGDVVKSYMTFDFHASYDLPEGMLGGDSIYITINNLADARPPFYNSAGQAILTGADDLVTNPLGRLTTIGIRAKF
jgi:iron complex outermembrane receptor protein